MTAIDPMRLAKRLRDAKYRAANPARHAAQQRAYRARVKARDETTKGK